GAGRRRARERSVHRERLRPQRCEGRTGPRAGRRRNPVSLVHWSPLSMALPQIIRSRRWLLAGVGLIVAIVAFVAWRQLAPKEETDDAQVAGHVSPISTRVGGAIL